jgi:hypothetical protein
MLPKTILGRFFVLYVVFLDISVFSDKKKQVSVLSAFISQKHFILESDMHYTVL